MISKKSPKGNNFFAVRARIAQFRFRAKSVSVYFIGWRFGISSVFV